MKYDYPSVLRDWEQKLRKGHASTAKRYSSSSLQRKGGGTSGRSLQRPETVVPGLDSFAPRFEISYLLLWMTVALIATHVAGAFVIVPLYSARVNETSPYVFLSILLFEATLLSVHYLFLLRDMKKIDPLRVYFLRSMDYMIAASLLLGLVGVTLILALGKSPRVIAVLYAVLFVPFFVVLGFLAWGFLSLWVYVRHIKKLAVGNHHDNHSEAAGFFHTLWSWVA